MGGRNSKLPVVKPAQDDDIEWQRIEVSSGIKEIVELLVSKGIIVDAKVQKVSVDGVCRTKDFIVQKEVQEVLEAKNFAEVIKKSLVVTDKLESLGIFQKVKVLIDVSKGPNATEDGYEVKFTVEETSRVKGGVSSSFNLNELNGLVSLQLPNFTGITDRVLTEFGIGSNKSKTFHASYIRPLFDFEKAEFKTSVFQNHSQRPMSGFKLTEQGISTEISAHILPWLKHSFQWEGTIRNLSVLSKQAPFEVREQSGYTLKSALRYVLTADTRNSAVLPTKGNFFQFSNEWAGLGGNTNFLKHELAGQMNWPLFSDFVLQLSGKGGLMHNWGQKYKAEICDRFFLGGPLNLRGFQQDGIGPQVDSFFLGAPTYWAGSLHLYTPIPFISSSTLTSLIRPHIFLNCGNISNLSGVDIQSNVAKLGKDICVSAGFGLCIRLGQVGRLEMNYCIPLASHPNDASVNGPQFGFGFTFL